MYLSQKYNDALARECEQERDSEESSGVDSELTHDCDCGD